MAFQLYRASVTPTTPVSTTAKGAPLTNLEVDGNFKALNDDVITKQTAAQVSVTVDASAAIRDSNALAYAIALG